MDMDKFCCINVCSLSHNTTKLKSNVFHSKTKRDSSLRNRYHTLSICFFRSGAAADTANSLYLNVESEHDWARPYAADAITLFPAPAGTHVVVGETRAGAHPADQILTSGSPELDHLDKPDQGESAGEQRSEQDVQELSLHTAIEAKYHSVSRQKNDGERHVAVAAAALRPAEVQLDLDAAGRADGRRHSRDGRR